jgi:hypothetical protein
MTPNERIAVLLEYLVDVREGLPETERRRSDEMLALMCEAWNSPPYQELERLLPLMRWAEPVVYWHVAERWLRYGEVRRAWCRKCGEHPAGQAGKVHSHPPGKAVTLEPRIVRSWHPALDPRLADRGVEWLARHFRVEPDLPKAVLMVESERRLRAA